MVAGGLDQCGEGVKEGVEVGLWSRGGGDGERKAVGGCGGGCACCCGASGECCVCASDGGCLAVESRDLLMVVAVVGAEVVRGAMTLAAYRLSVSSSWSLASCSATSNGFSGSDMVTMQGLALRATEMSSARIVCAFVTLLALDV